MGNEKLQINFSLDDQSGINPYWLRMELVEPEDGQMTVGEAADFIDALYNVSLCGEADPVEEPDGSDWDRALDLISLPTCDNLLAMEDDPGSYDCEVRVYRSHADELYKIILTNGTIGLVVQKEERVIETIDIEDLHYITLDRPIRDRPVVAWQGIDGPDINITGNTLWWDGYFTGVLRIEFDTAFDLVPVHVHGINNQDSEVITGTDESFFGDGWYSGDEDGTELLDINDQQCTLLGFYHYQYEELVLSKPENDESESINELCAYAGSTHMAGDDGFNASGGGGDCFAKQGFNDICICGGEENEAVENVPVPCPSGTNAGEYVPESEKNEITDRYVDCGNPDEVHEPGYYEETCCEPWPFYPTDLPLCLEHYAKFTGLNLTDDIKSDLRQKYGDNVNIIGVGPREGVCGHEITTQKVSQGNCCEGVTAIVWDHDQSIQILAPNATGAVFVSGGLGVKEWKVRGTDLWLDKDRKIRDGIGGNAVNLYAGPDFCGSGSIYVTDGCSSASNGIRGTEGVWRLINSGRFVHLMTTSNGYWNLRPPGIVPVNGVFFDGGNILSVEVPQQKFGSAAQICSNCLVSGIAACTKPQAMHAPRCSNCVGYTCTITDKADQDGCTTNTRLQTSDDFVDTDSYTILDYGVYGDIQMASEGVPGLFIRQDQEPCYADGKKPGYTMWGLYTLKYNYEWVC